MKKKWILVFLAPLVLLGAWFFFFRGPDETGEVEYRYSKAEKGTVRRSISATGQLVALTQVDVKSKAGGKVIQLLVDEGSPVKKGDVIAIIDPSDTKSIYEQAQADVTAAQARAQQARENYALQIASSSTSIQDAQAQLTAARARLERAQIEYNRQPVLARTALDTAQAGYDSALQALTKFDEVLGPRMRRDAQSALSRSDTALRTAEANLRRDEELLSKGYVAQAAVDQSRTAYQSAKAEFDVATQRMNTLDSEVQAERKTLQLAVDRAKAALEQARASGSDVGISQRNLQEAKSSVKQSEINLQRARDNQRNNSIRRSEIEAASAGAVRSKVQLENAKVQLDSTTVVAPRDGVVTMKYLEEGTIIPPGTSTFAQGTSLVQISDTTDMFVQVSVDEADIGNVKEGQRVIITTEAFPGQPFDGVVERVNPTAITDQNITAVKVRVKVMAGSKVRIMPGMNATCEFVTLEKKGVLMVPSQAVQREEGKTYVRVKGPKGPIQKEVQLGEAGNDGVEVLSGIGEGEEVVVGEIDLAEMREIQRRMEEAQEGGGLAGGGNRGPTSRGTTTGGARGGGTGGGGGGGGARGGGGR